MLTNLPKVTQLVIKYMNSIYYNPRSINTNIISIYDINFLCGYKDSYKGIYSSMSLLGTKIRSSPTFLYIWKTFGIHTIVEIYESHNDHILQ